VVFYPLGYNRSLDGLRAFAVLSVLLYHAQIAGFSWGWNGVDVFFVISGFLITGTLLLEFERDRSIDLLAFYKRRALRLFPALVLLCLAFLLLGALTKLGWQSALLEVAIVAAYAGNWTRAFEQGIPGHLGHTWSLAIEEQYYLLWPLALVLLVPLASRRRNWLAAVLALALLVACWRALLYLQGAGINRLYNGTDTRADALLLGSALAFAVRIDRARQALGWAVRALWLPALLVIVVLPLAFPWDGAAMLCGGYTLIAAAGAILVMATGTDGPVRSLLGMQPLVWIGQRSYGLYLWGHPIMSTCREVFELPMAAAGPISIAGAFVCAAVSYALVERPFLRLRYLDQTPARANVLDEASRR
jgi:peptidoglycan/LPS O-acetylase OafA/YrhL